MKFIRVMFSSGHVEEGILEDWNQDEKWISILVKGDIDKIINIKKKYIAAYEINEINNKPIVKIKNNTAETAKTTEIKNLLTAEIKNSLFRNSILKAKKLADLRMAKEQSLKEKISEEYSEAVYTPHLSIFKK